MTDIYSSRGWKNRRKLAEINSYGNADAERQAIRAERARIYAEAEETNARAAEAYAALLAAEECACTACGGTGRLPVPKAMRVVKALHNFGFHDHVVTKAEIAALAAVAKGAPIPPGCVPVMFSYGSISPAPGHASRLEPAAVAAETVEPPKPSRPAKVMKQTEDQFTADGALIEV